MKRPDRAFIIDKKGKKRPNPFYESYLFGILKITPEEVREWRDLEVHLTLAKMRRLTCYESSLEWIMS